MATGFPQKPKFNKVNRNKKEMKRGANSYWVCPTKTDPDCYQNAVDFRWSDLQEEAEEDIALAKFIESLQKQPDSGKHSKKVTVKLFDGYCIVPNEKKIKKIFLTTISNTKIFNIKFCSVK